MKYRSLYSSRLRVFLPVIALLMVGMLAACSTPSLPGFSSSAPASAVQAQPETQSQAQISAPDTVESASTSASVHEIAPTITVDPPGGYGGIYIRVTGAGWPRNMAVLITLADDEGKSNTLATANTDFEGNLSTGFLYPIDGRWLQNRVYRVMATTADGRHDAVAAFNVGEPGTAVAAAPPATAPELPAVETAPEEAASENEPVAEEVEAGETEVAEAETEEVEATPEAVAEAAQDEENQGEQAADEREQDEQEEGEQEQDESAGEKGEDEIVEAAEAGHDMPVAFTADDIMAGFIPVEVKRNKGKYTILARVEGYQEAGYDLVASIRTPSLEDYANVKLERDDDWEVKFGRNKVEIEVPDPDDIVSFMEIYGGFPVDDGQLVEIKLRDTHKVELELDDGVLEIKASEVALQVFLIGPDGETEMVVATLNSYEDPPGLRRERGPVVDVPPEDVPPEEGRRRRSGPPSWARNWSDR